MPDPRLVYEDEYVRLWHGDARRWLTGYAPSAAAIVTDPPYADTSLAWDKLVDGWQDTTLAPQAWVFGSLQRPPLAAVPVHRQLMHAPAVKRQMRRKHGPPHTGDIGAGDYATVDGGPKLMRSVQYVRSEHGRAVHPTQKPLGILRPLIEYSVAKDALVLDPFAGSASTLLAAREIGRRAEVCEISAEYCAAAICRLNALTLEVA